MAPTVFVRKKTGGLPFTPTYIDDILVFSDPVKHKEQLHQVFKKVCMARSATYIGCPKYLTWVMYYQQKVRMSADPKKTQAVVEWSWPTDVVAVTWRVYRACLLLQTLYCKLCSVLYAYRISRHASTGVSPFQMMFGCQPKLRIPENTVGVFDNHSYQARLCGKLAELQDLVTSNSAAAAHSQQQSYKRLTKQQQFSPGNLVWLSIPNASKLAPHW